MAPSAMSVRRQTAQNEGVARWRIAGAGEMTASRPILISSAGGFCLLFTYRGRGDRPRRFSAVNARVAGWCGAERLSIVSQKTRPTLDTNLEIRLRRWAVLSFDSSAHALSGATSVVHRSGSFDKFAEIETPPDTRARVRTEAKPNTHGSELNES